ncbi:Zinc finger FYVE domain-containing protein 21 [Amphibalanus amphitrite]|uniref:Zinc finger FYVE domain-containing protein 21 n=1 Tax=Amphibalanus amphitrite TaxID=1232801 RepID=A0A6A4V8F0_AMPAM|nr:zinc finger FYVE domain-containing protein 21-like [Amphibalanus amphitrite]XP_043196979.1 zinc finger FYVE domain-containing protein 21-like [Amphibalanus amphitrite]XP_043196980.1 zinc finger FYVE domain-containing protein 21-like [Amphibalanus amphitrite]XP_043196981.1 zinc finger FYVE domain-containing protein 21-like [Amphibalanus amphitrite]XP_043196982.1 zinc finger FYVE domain-containing protein 21-like [Amphibalanus amphitrite]XP_043196983.1 zinc finger FYVE domain-containing prote
MADGICREDDNRGAGNKKLTKSKSGLRIIPINNTARSPFELKEPTWSPDKENPECSNGKCGQKFDFLKRRHHCRRCGQIFCAQCCQTRVMLPRMCFVDPVRQCFRCSDITNAENVFFNSSLKLLTNGAQFDVSSPERPVLCQTAVTSDHRFIRFEPTQGQAPPERVEVARILSTEVTQSTIEYAPGQTLPEAVVVLYRVPGSVEERQVRLSAGPHVNDWRLSANWIVALERALELVYEGRQPSQH